MLITLDIEKDLRIDMTKIKEKIKDWTSDKWHLTHNWRAGTGKFLKRIMNRKIRHQKIKEEEYYD